MGPEVPGLIEQRPKLQTLTAGPDRKFEALMQYPPAKSTVGIRH